MCEAKQEGCGQEPQQVTITELTINIKDADGNTGTLTAENVSATLVMAKAAPATEEVAEQTGPGGGGTEEAAGAGAGDGKQPEGGAEQA